MDSLFFVTIAIPSYNRPQELKRLLNSIDYTGKFPIEILICEDKSPKRTEVREVVNSFKDSSRYTVSYFENEQNYGYDKNIRELVSQAQGEYIIFMGDDDLFIEGKLNYYIEYLWANQDCGYVLRSYMNNYSDGTIEVFKYFNSTRRFDAGIETYILLFDKSVFISGFTIRTQPSQEVATEKLDGTLLYQLYLLAEVCLKMPAAYYDIPITKAIEGGVPYFGNSEKEKKLYTSGSITIDNSLNFIRGYFSLLDFVDQKHNINVAGMIKKNMSKYSYPILAIQRCKGKSEFRKYCGELRVLGLGESFYFDIYYVGLFCFGKKYCDRIIKALKRIIGHRPRL